MVALTPFRVDRYTATAGLVTPPTAAVYHHDKRVGNMGGPRTYKRWEKKEDAQLCQLRRSGETWKGISEKIPGRSYMSCRQRYRQYLSARTSAYATRAGSQSGTREEEKVAEEQAYHGFGVRLQLSSERQSLKPGPPERDYNSWHQYRRPAYEQLIASQQDGSGDGNKTLLFQPAQALPPPENSGTTTLPRIKELGGISTPYIPGSFNGERMFIPVDTNSASKAAGEKRQRNAGASARLRQRKKDKEKEKDMRLGRLENQNRGLEAELERIRADRDRLRQIVSQIPEISNLAHPPGRMHVRH
ncbi:hypothetical protein DL764_007431 [Monosporascus ibericus]|uniref:Myb-like domain-containing protein n=1 Tax=Monosporascus ibericus TaxID=155417 RepID=A0A4Q4T0Q7_9PEZI|nr:hypothetical protein DL764_007431 [Monosporascus ibericus]